MNEIMHYNGIIYKITNIMNNMVYVGSTKNKYLCSRIAVHIAYMKRAPDRKLYKAMHELGINNFTITKIEDFKYDKLSELRTKEQYYINLYNSIDNGYNEFYAIKNVERKKEQVKKTNFKRKDEIIKWTNKNKNKYYCETCKYGSHNKYNYNEHLKTILHNNQINNIIY